MHPAAPTTPLITALAHLGPHDHLCAIYESEEEQFQIALPFIRIGLERGEQCLYIADHDHVGAVREAMRRAGMDVDRATHSQALTVLTPEQTYLMGGSFHLEAMVTFWEEAIARARHEGFTALRATGDTEWMLRGAPGLERWIEYERRLMHTLTAHPCVALCQYDRRRCPPALLREVIRTHPTVISRGTLCRNLYYVPPEEWLGPDQPAREVERLLTTIRARETVESTLQHQRDELRASEHRLATQYAVTCLLAESDTLADAMPRLLQAIGERLGWEWGALWTIDRDAGVLRCAHIWHAPDLEAEALDAISRQTAGLPGQGLKGRVWQSAEPTWMAEVTQDPYFMRAPIAARMGLRGAVAFPILRRGETLGILEFFSRAISPPDAAQLAMLAAMGNQIGQFVERKRAEELLRAANARIAMILDSITDNFFAIDKDWRFTYLNTHAQAQMQVLGKDPAHLIGSVLWEEFPDVPNEVAVRRVMSERVAITDEVYYAPLGEWVENHMYPSADGGIAVFTRYVTERKRAEENLRRSEAYLAQAQRLSHTGSGSWNVVTGEVIWSDETYRIYGFELGRVTPSYDVFFNLVLPEDRRDLEEAFARVVREQRAYEFDFRIRRPDGTLRYIHSAGQPLFNAAGDLTEILGTVVDLTERKQAEEALLAAQAELAHVMRVLTLGALTASIAHEVNQPLGAMVTNGYACLRWLARDVPDLGEARAAIARIIRDGHRASDVIRRIRALAQHTAPQKTWLDLNDVIREVVTLVHHEVDTHRIALHTDLSAALPPVLADRVHVQQVLLNLLMNGIEALDPVTDRPRELRIRSQRHDADTVLVAVQDTGIGLDPYTVDRLFDALITTKPDGMGLGLSICRTIIEAHGGRLWASPNDGPGATFLFTLPMGATMAGVRRSEAH